MLRRTFVTSVVVAGAYLDLPVGGSAQTDAGTPPAALPGSGYVDVNGLEMYFERHGSAGQSLLLLHGGLTTSDLSFGALLPVLAERYQVITVELQAHGHTADIDRPLSYEQMADDVATLLGELGIARTDVFGFSLGGGVALQLAIRHPALVRKAVLASTPYQSTGWAPEIRAAMGVMTGDVMVGTPLHEAYVSVAPNPDDWSTLVAKVSELQTGSDYDWTAGVETVTAPTLLIIGDADSVLPAHTLAFFQLLGGGVVGDLGPLPAVQLAVLPGTGHSAVLTRADQLLAITLPFLDAPLPEAG